MSNALVLAFVAGGPLFRKKNGSWRAQVSLDGRRLSYTAKTKKECQEWIKKTLGQIDDGMTFASTQITLEEYLSGWIASKKSSLRHTTWTQYKLVIDKYIVPQIGHIKIRGLRPTISKFSMTDCWGKIPAITMPLPGLRIAIWP